MNTPGGNTVSTAELTLAHLMALARNVPQACISLKDGKWDRKAYTGNELHGKTLGIIGLGRIGREVAAICSHIGMTVVAYDPLATAGPPGVSVCSLEDVLAQADYITVHSPKTKDTANLLNAAAFAKCKRGVRIINCARGGIVHEGDLLAALHSGQVAGAALDVYEMEPPGEASAALLAHPAVICSPHLGASTAEAQVNVAADIARQFVDALSRGQFAGVVNAARMDYVSRADLAPVLDLGDRLGSLQAQLMASGGGSISSLSITLAGKTVADPAVAAVLRTAVLKGLMSEMRSSGNVNFVNAGMLAEEAGLAVEVTMDPPPPDGGDVVSVQVELDGGARGHRVFSLQATLVGGSPRLLAINGFAVDIRPEGDMLFFTNTDKAGVLRDITRILGEAGVNIADFNLGRAAPGGQAVGVLTLDAPVPASVLTKIEGVSNVSSVATASLPLRASRAPSSSVPAAAALHAASAPRPAVKPRNPQFGSGPTTKRPGWSLSALSGAALGRSHRSAVGKDKLRYAIDQTAAMLGMPEGYKLGIVPGSDTGAYEMAMWSMLGARPVDALHWESFGKGWASDAKTHLALEGVHEYSAEYGHLPDLSQVNPDHDVLFTWNGTTSGVKVPNGDFISSDRSGLTFVDATSAVFAQDVPLEKCDVLTYSWQKVLGGEGAHGMLMLSPAAVERLETYTPPRPLPKVFRMTKGGKLINGIFTGATINTPSMLCVEDYLDALAWAEAQGGAKALMARADANLAVISDFVQAHDWIDFLPVDPATRSNTSVCLSLDLPADKIKAMTSLLEAEGVAFDIGAYRDAPAGLRIWAGATVEKEDMAALMPWLQWAYHVVSM